MKALREKIAIVAGASRGAVRGIALALGDAGATVYVAARTSRSGKPPADNAPGTVEGTAEEVNARGGQGIPITVDLGNEEQLSELFRRVKKDHGPLDLLANSVWSAHPTADWSKKFWQLGSSLWHEAVSTLTACWLTSVYAAPMMVEHGGGLIVHVTDNLWPDPSAYRGQILYDLGHEGINRLIAAMSKEAKKAKITVIGLNPGFMRTERVLMHMKTEALKRQYRFDLSESPEYIGRAVAALAADKNVIQKTGQLLWASDMAQEYGFTDVDGRFIPRFDPKAPEQPFPC